MREAFAAAPGAPFLDLDLLRWKYSRGDSYALVQNGRVISHGCAWPVASVTRVRTICLIDWVSAKGVPGMGIMLARKIGGLADVMLSIGGSEMTQQIMPKIGFVRGGELDTYARVLRPWKQFWTRPGVRDRKAWMRLGRNWAWSLAPLQGRGRAVRADVDPYLAACPGAVVSGWDFGMLSRVGGQCRIARFLGTGYSAAVRAALEDPEACELIALGHDAETRAGLEAAGFRKRGSRAVFVYDPGKRLTDHDFPLPLTMLDDDLFYLNTPEYPFAT